MGSKKQSLLGLYLLSQCWQPWYQDFNIRWDNEISTQCRFSLSLFYNSWIYCSRLVDGTFFSFSFILKRGFLFQAIGLLRPKDKLTKENCLSEKKELCFLHLPVGLLVQADLLSSGLLVSCPNRRGDKNLSGVSVFVEVNDGEGLERIFQIRLFPGKWCLSITRSPLCMSYSHCWGLGGDDPPHSIHLAPALSWINLLIGGKDDSLLYSEKYCLMVTVIQFLVVISDFS